LGKVAFITGVTGQDGAYLSRFLLDRGYSVFGAVRRTSSKNLWRLKELGIENEINLVSLDLLEITNIMRVLEKVQPEEIYNLAAQSFVELSFEQPIYTGDVDGIGVARLLEAIRVLCPEAHFYQASTSEMFGNASVVPQSETTPFAPRSPYAAAKLYAHWMSRNYREAYGLFTANGILFNHESPLRGSEFVTRKISLALARIRHGGNLVLEVGNLDAKRDWGFAGDYVEGMWMMLQQDVPSDYVLATGETHSVREYVETTAETLGFNLDWEGHGLEEKAYDRKTGKILVKVNSRFFRPAEVNLLCGDSGKASEELGWSPRTRFKDLARLMAEEDMRRVHDDVEIH
jgi:GDPmannose 4,6-dehydratase